VHRSFSIILPLLLLTTSCHSQSLGERARQLQEQKKKTGSSPARAVTNDDLSPSPAPSPAPQPDAKTNQAKPGSAKTLGYESFTPETWQRSIAAQKQWVAFLQKELDKLKIPPPPQFDAKNIATDLETRRYWEEREMQQQHALQLAEQQKKLKELQDEARKAGMPPAIYDPQ
jgi:hypothetical protein